MAPHGGGKEVVLPRIAVQQRDHGGVRRAVASAGAADAGPWRAAVL